MNYKGFGDMRDIIRKNISFLQIKNFDLIVGIPRSGMIPAFIIANYLNKECCDLETFINKCQLNNNTKTKTVDVQKVLLVDDSIASGESLAKSLKQIPSNKHYKVTTLCIYSTEKERNDVDLFLEHIPGLGIFEWNILHSFMVKNSCVNMEGVLCEEPTDKQINIKGSYLEYINIAKVVNRPTGKISYIITERPEKYRSETEEWLYNHSIKYDKLIMGINGSYELAKVFKKSGKLILFEKNYIKAKKIHSITKRAVFCTETNELLYKGFLASVINGCKHHRNELLNLIRKKLENYPKPFYNFLRIVYRMVNGAIPR